MRRAFQIIREGETVKKYLLLLLPLCLLLSGCGHSKREAVQDYYASIRTAQAERRIFAEAVMNFYSPVTDRLRAELAEVQAGSRARCRSYETIGICAGLALAVILL